MISELFSKHYLVRRLLMLWMMWMTTEAILWAMTFAEQSDRTGADLAMIIAAVIAPVTTLQGFVAKFYNEARANGQSVSE